MTPVGAPHPRIALPARSVRARARQFGGPRSRQRGALAELGDALRRERGAAARRRRATDRAAIRNPADHARCRRPVVEARARPRSTRPASRAARRCAGLGVDAPPSARGHPRRSGRPVRGATCGRLAGLIVPRSGQDAAQCDRRRARGGRFPALLRRRDRATASPTRRIARSASSPASARGISRSRSSPARSRAALAAGNAVIAKPAEETPLIAAEAVRLLHEAGVPADALQLLAGDGDGRRGADRRRACRRRDVHRLDRSRAADRSLARRPPRRRTARRFR